MDRYKIERDCTYAAVTILIGMTIAGILGLADIVLVLVQREFE